ILGFFRTYLLLTVVTSVVLGAILARRAPALWTAAAAAASIPLFLLASRLAYASVLSVPERWEKDPTTHTSLLVEIYSPGKEQYIGLFPPRRIAETRRVRQEADAGYAKNWYNRDIGTQLFHGQQLDSWLDVALFIPKSAFYVLFMPLPGLYPLA